MSTTMKELLKPSKCTVNEKDNNTSEIIIEPLERGFGHTLGNALRRVLLSSMPGCAVTELEILEPEVLHEYTTMEGVQEDVTDIILNLKGLAIIMHSKDEATLTLKKSGPGEVCARDITVDHDVEIANPEHVIANLTKAGQLSMVMKVVRSRGYKPVIAGGKDDEQTIGKIKLDASYSPVTRVSYDVGNARVEQRTDLDKLILQL